jgi:hypothetical protein
MKRSEILFDEAFEPKGPSVREVILREQLLKETVFAYGIAVAVAAGVAGILIYVNLI